MDRTEAVRALEENFWDMWAAFGRGPGCTLVDRPDLLRFETPIPNVPYNTVLRTRLGGDDATIDAEIERTLAAYDDRDVALVWVVHPTAEPADLGDRLRAHGLDEVEVCPGMVACVSDLPEPDPPPDGVTIERVTLGNRTDFTRLTMSRYSLSFDSSEPLHAIIDAHRFGHPDCPTRGWMARLPGGTIASKAIAHLGAGVTGLYAVATAPEAVGRGLARTVTLTALHDAATTGADLAVLHSTPMAVSLYSAMGFDRVADFALYARPGTPQI